MYCELPSLPTNLSFVECLRLKIFFIQIRKKKYPFEVVQNEKQIDKYTAELSVSSNVGKRKVCSIVHWG